MTVIKLLLFFLLLNIIPVFFLKKSFGKTIPFTFIVSTLLLYMFGFIDNLKYGYYLLLGLCIFSVILIIFIFFKDRNRFKEFLKNYFSIGFIAYILLYAFITLLQLKRGYMYIDDFGHWGLFVKESFRLNKFYCVNESNVWGHKEYPPFYTLFEVLWCYIAKGYNESYCFRALNMFSLSLFLPIIDRYELKLKNLPKIVLCVLAIIMSGFILNQTEHMYFPALVYNSTYLDWPMAIYLAFNFYLVYTFDFDKTRDYIYLAISLAGFILTKNTALAFYLLIIGTLIIKLIINKKIKIVGLILSIVVPYIYYKGWSLYYSMCDFDSTRFALGKYDFFLFFKYLGGKADEYCSGIISSFMNNLMTTKLMMKPIKLPYVFAVIFICVLMVVEIIIFKNNRKNKILITVMYFLGAIAYAYSMMLAYCFSFDAIEGPSLAEYGRYMTTYIYTGLILCFILYLIDIKGYGILFVIVSLILFISPDTIKQTPLATFKSISRNDDSVYRYVSFMSKVSPDTIVYRIYNRDHTGEYRYRFYGSDYEHQTYRYFVNDDMDNEDIHSSVSAKEFVDNISKVDYIFIDDDGGLKNYWQLISDEDVKEGYMYKVVNDENGTHVEIIYEY